MNHSIYKLGRWIGRILGGFVILGLFSGLVAGEDPIVLSATSIRPGEFLQVRVNADQTSHVKVYFLGTSKKLDPGTSASAVGLFAASSAIAPGSYPLAVEINRDGMITTALYSITVNARAFPEDRIVLPETRRQSALSPASQSEDDQKLALARGKAWSKGGPSLWEGSFIWPVKGKITTEFGLIRFVNDIPEGRHSGLDIAAPAGTPVMASGTGRVIFAGRLNLTGLTVIIYHGLDLYSSYCHLSAIRVREGDSILKGAVLGDVGATGLATGAHLHLTYRIGEVAVDPYLILDHRLDWNF